MNPDKSTDAAELRRRAEARLSEKQQSSRSTDGDQRTEADLRRLQHELEVHQIELEMQNEELQQAQGQTETALGKYTDLYDFAPTGYFTLTGDGTILAVNLTGSRLVGLERARLLNRHFGFLISEADRLAFSAFLQKVFAGKERVATVVVHADPRRLDQPQDPGERLDLRCIRAVGLDADEDFVYFSYNGGPASDGVDVNNPVYSQYIEPGTKSAKVFGPRGMGAGPSGLASMNLKTGEVKLVTAVPFQIGHVQTNPWVHGEIIFCWETGGKAPQRTWVVNSDGTGLRPLFPEADFDWVTHEAVITKDEVAIAILYTHPVLGGERRGPPPVAEGQPPAPQGQGGQRGRGGNGQSWGIAGNDEHPTGVGIVNLRTREMRIIGQVPFSACGLGGC